MAGIRFPKLVDQFIDALERNDGTVIRANARDEVRPARFRLITEKRTDCILFLWTITPGGGGAGVRPADERRIQITNVSRMPLEPGVRTLLGGYSEEHNVYAFWDARRHISFGSSPSLQVSDNTLETAAHVGIATQLRPTAQGQEVVVAVSPESLLWYVENGLQLHNAEADALSVVDLAEATPEEERDFLDSATTEEESANRYDLVETMRAYRDAKFRPAVLKAYAYKCAVCSCDLKLVDAAHIVPLSHPQSSNLVTNGIALCRLHHGAYDSALLGIRPDYKIVINNQRVKRLTSLKFATGLERFREQLPEKIRVPIVIEVRPSSESLRLGLELRQWPVELIA